MSNQPPYGNPPGGGGYPPPPGGGGYPPPPPGGGGYPPPGGGYPPPGGGYPGGGGDYPPPGGNYPPPNENKTKTFGMAYNTAALLSYLPSCLCCVNAVFGIIWLSTEPKENRFLRFHAMQGLLLFGVWFVVWLIFTILGIALGVGMSFSSNTNLAGVGGILVLRLIQLLVYLALLVIHIIGMVKASQGQVWKLPVIGNIAEKNS